MSWSEITDHFKDLVRENASGTPIAVEADKNSGDGKGKEPAQPERMFPPTGQINGQPATRTSNRPNRPSQSNTIDLTNEDEDTNAKEDENFDYLPLIRALVEQAEVASLADRVLERAAPKLTMQILEKVSPKLLTTQVLKKAAPEFLELLERCKLAYENDDAAMARKLFLDLGYELTEGDMAVLLASSSDGLSGDIVEGGN